MSKNTTLTLIASGIILASSVPSVYFFYQYQKAQERLKNPAATTKVDNQKLIDTVGKLIVLPTGEAPTIATVSDVTKLANQPFFTHAQNGDQLLIYQQAKKAILYRPQLGKIIEVGPVTINNTASASATGPVPQATSSAGP